MAQIGEVNVKAIAKIPVISGFFKIVKTIFCALLKIIEARFARNAGIAYPLIISFLSKL